MKYFNGGNSLYDCISLLGLNSPLIMFSKLYLQLLSVPMKETFKEIWTGLKEIPELRYFAISFAIIAAVSVAIYVISTQS
jgi:hypothetical protein